MTFFSPTMNGKAFNYVFIRSLFSPINNIRRGRLFGFRKFPKYKKKPTVSVTTRFSLKTWKGWWLLYLLNTYSYFSFHDSVENFKKREEFFAPLEKTENLFKKIRCVRNTFSFRVESLKSAHPFLPISLSEFGWNSRFSCDVSLV